MNNITKLFILLLLLYLFFNKQRNTSNIKKDNENIIEKYDLTMNGERNIRIHIYDFDNTLTSKPLKINELYHYKNKPYTIRELYMNGMLYDIFGSKERVENLKKHLSHLKDKGIKLYVVSFNRAEYIRKALEYMGLLKFFDCIYGTDNTDMAITGNKTRIIRETMDRLSIPYYQGIFVDNNSVNLKLVNDLMYTYKPKDVSVGLQEEDLQILRNA